MSGPAQRGTMVKGRHIQLSRTARGMSLWASDTNEDLEAEGGWYGSEK